ncbi:hypothetical protein TCE0_015f02039 [Talaromyces pinophilus]|uniref:Uncharacterized protein n=1 Tax=Talaromyces pinophilus TaxID=128442 RepID=A0A6V8GZH4_TALPI|nr:hypothetical protein DPV78_005335 [Talaromyces pinophilus]GAM34450.1 hypothetical protein TCE0_015f02039 [Talaromyces pinophilus]
MVLVIEAAAEEDEDQYWAREMATSLTIATAFLIEAAAEADDTVTPISGEERLRMVMDEIVDIVAIARSTSSQWIRMMA